METPTLASLVAEYTALKYLADTALQVDPRADYLYKGMTSSWLRRGSTGGWVASYPPEGIGAKPKPEELTYPTKEGYYKVFNSHTNHWMVVFLYVRDGIWFVTDIGISGSIRLDCMRFTRFVLVLDQDLSYDPQPR